MKNILPIIIAILAFTFSANSQWSTDPANPLLVCNVGGWQNSAQSVPDGSGGAFVFWRDSRLSLYIFEVYGQHYDADGVALWEANGRLIISDPDGKNLEFFSLYRYDDGKMIICWYAGAAGPANPDEKMWVQELDDEGAKVWENDLALSEEHPTGPLSVGAYSTCQLVRDGLGFHVLMEIQTYGYNRMRISRFSETGELLMQFDGVELGPLSFGHARITTDGANGAYLYYSSGNGAGATLHCMHIDEYAVELWAGWADVTANTTGLSYQFSGIGDATGITFVWQGGGVNAEELFARRINMDGTWAWDGATTEICTFEGVQKNFYLEKQGDNYYIVWADGRPGMVGYSAIYGQKFDNSGLVLWQEDGVQIANLNTYIPNPKFALDSDLNMYACHQSTVYGYVSQKVDDSGAPQWDADGQQLSTTAFNPFYENHQEFLSGTNLLAAWVKPADGGGADGVYITRITPPMVNITETVSACDTYTLNDINYTESGTYTQELPGDTLLTLELTINYSEAQFFEQVACGSYEFDGEVLTASGFYQHVYTNQAGCDSTLNLELAILEVDVNVTQEGNTLTANESGAQYTWINCDGNISTGTTTQSFTPAETGEYAVIIQTAQCADTSTCTLVTIIAVEEMGGENSFTAFPNPFVESFAINISGLASLSSIQLLDVMGRKVFEQDIQTPHEVFAPHIAPGTYCVRVADGAAIYSRIIIKQ